MVTVGGGDITPAAARLQIVLAHQALDPLLVGDHAAMAKRRLHAAPAIGFELVADRGDCFDSSVVHASRRRIIIG